MYRWLRGTKGFTLVEIMIVVAIIGLLIAIALPNFVKARNTARINLCKNNLRLIGHALEQWRVDTNASATAQPAAIGTLGEYIKGDVLPTCPAAGTYAYVAGEPDQINCNATGHGTYDISDGSWTVNP